MRKIVRRMIEIYRVLDLSYDMMGYIVYKKDDLSFHHLLVPKRFGGSESFWNGAILRRDTSHDYLHLIEKIDPDIFYGITKEMNEEKLARKIQLENLKRIREMLLSFEREHDRDRSECGRILIKREYVEKRIKL